MSYPEGLNQGDALLPLFLNSALEYSHTRFQKTRRDWYWIGLISFWNLLRVLSYGAKNYTL